jgi:hypothetical protein
MSERRDEIRVSTNDESLPPLGQNTGGMPIP